MAASEYLSTKQEDGENAVKSSIYTGLAYIFTGIFLVLPFLLISNPFVSLGVSLGVALLIIFIFNYYISVAKDYNFKQRFLEMASISIVNQEIKTRYTEYYTILIYLILLGHLTGSKTNLS